jgi:hypothetical protein
MPILDSCYEMQQIRHTGVILPETIRRSLTQRTDKEVSQNLTRKQPE